MILYSKVGAFKVKFRNKIINALVMIPTILAIILVSYNTKTIRKFVGVIIISFFNKNISYNIRVFYENNLISIFKIIIVISIVFLCIFILALFGHDSIKKNDKDLKNSDNKLFKGLYKYLEEEKKRCFLITGYSGSGKTYNLKKFLDEYFMLWNINKNRSYEQYKVSVRKFRQVL